MFHPNANFFYESPANRRKLIFPSDRDLGEVTGLTAKKLRGRVAYEADDVDRQYGITWFLDRVAEVTGIRKDLLHILGSTIML